jgi:hypothetical protein
MHEPPTDDLVLALREVVGEGKHFGHREHLHLAWLAIHHDGPNAEATLTRWLWEIATRHGMPERFHATLTAAWVRLVSHHLAGDPGGGDFEGFLARNPGLLDSTLVGRHYRPGTLHTSTARQRWVPPDRVALPA